MIIIGTQNTFLSDLCLCQQIHDILRSVSSISLKFYIHLGPNQNQLGLPLF